MSRECTGPQKEKTCYRCNQPGTPLPLSARRAQWVTDGPRQVTSPVNAPTPILFKEVPADSADTALRVVVPSATSAARLATSPVSARPMAAAAAASEASPKAVSVAVASRPATLAAATVACSAIPSWAPFY